MADDKYLTIQELAEHFTVSVSTVRAWIRTGAIPESKYLKVGNTYRFKVQEVEPALREFALRRALEMAEKTAAEPTVDQDF
jgi:excisionase family DNA binding protein